MKCSSTIKELIPAYQVSPVTPTGIMLGEFMRLHDFVHNRTGVVVQKMDFEAFRKLSFYISK